MKKYVDLFLIALLLYLSGDTLIRRLVFEQWPTQISGFWVYAILTINALIAGILVRKILYRQTRQPSSQA